MSAALFEFCCRSGGDNTNAGTRTGNSTVPGTSADLTYAGGSYVQSTRVFTVASGNPVNDGVAVGDAVSVFTSGATVTGWVGLVSARTSTTITIDGSRNFGSNPADGTYTLKVGGAWAGPSGAEDFPFDNSGSTGGIGRIGSTSTFGVRVNFKNDATYSSTAAWTLDNTDGPRVAYQGFTTAYGDGGIALFEGPTTGASYNLLTITGTSLGQWLIDMDFHQNGSTGNANGIVAANARFQRVAVRNMKGSGVSHNGSICVFDGCQFDSNGIHGLSMTGGDTLRIRRCSFTRNATHGLSDGAGGIMFVSSSLFAGNTSNGLNLSGAEAWLDECDFYSNGSRGVGNTTSSVYAENCNFVKNTTTGYYQTGTSNYDSYLKNCGFGVGTQANGTNIDVARTLIEEGSFNYATGVTPWNDPANGDFSLTLAAAKGTGYGPFLNRASGYGGTLSYPSVGAAVPAQTAARATTLISSRP